MSKLQVAFFLTLFLFVTQIAQASPIVLFDQSHGQQFLVEKNRTLDLSGLADLFAEEGAIIKTNSEPISDALLHGIDVLIISGPFAPVVEKEVNAILKFIHQGGRLAVMAHISQPLGALLSELGVVVSSLPVAEQENIIGSNPKDFTITNLKPHPLTRDMTSINIYGGWALMNTKMNIDIIARTSHKAWVDLNQNGQLNDRDAVQSFALVLAGTLGQGKFAVFGDDAIFQNQFLKDGNLLLGRNLAVWFLGEKKTI